jgi:hypothetical protein
LSTSGQLKSCVDCVNGGLIKPLKLLFLYCIALSLNAQSKTVLLIGDSQSVGPFGRKLDSLLRQNGFQVATYASCGSTLLHWQTGKKTNCGLFIRGLDGKITEKSSAPTPLLKDLLIRIKPQVVIFEFGGNYVSYKSDVAIQKEIKKVIMESKSLVERCVWVTHPNARNNSLQRIKLWKTIEDVVKPTCEIFLSQLITSYPENGGDGVHFSFKEGIPIAENWATKVFEAFFRNNL